MKKQKLAKPIRDLIINPVLRLKNSTEDEKVTEMNVEVTEKTEENRKDLHDRLQKIKKNK